MKKAIPGSRSCICSEGMQHPSDTKASLGSMGLTPCIVHDNRKQCLPTLHAVDCPVSWQTTQTACTCMPLAANGMGPLHHQSRSRRGVESDLKPFAELGKAPVRSRASLIRDCSLDLFTKDQRRLGGCCGIPATAKWAGTRAPSSSPCLHACLNPPRDVS